MDSKRRHFCLVAGVCIGGFSLPASASRGESAPRTSPADLTPRASRAGTIASAFEIISVTLPDEIVLGETFTAMVSIEYTGDSSVSKRISYNFEGNVIATTDETFEPGETTDVVLPNMKSSWLEEDGSLEPGTYTHSIGIENGPRKSAQVKVVESSDSGPIRIDSAELPSTIVPGETFEIRVSFTNTADQSTTTEITYAFDGHRVFSKKAELVAGESEQFVIPSVSLDMIETSVPGSVDPGEYTHSVGVPDGPRESRPVTVLAQSATSTEQPVSTTQPDSTAPNSDDAEGAESRQRGFLSNSGGGPEFLADAFNLTVLGFLLSVAGIVHQLLGGK